MRTPLLALLIGSAAWAQRPVAGPFLGFLPASGELRQLAGAPGAALIGAHLPLGAAANALSVSPEQDYVLALSAETGSLISIDRDGASHDLGAALSGANRIEISPRGKSALVWNAASSKAQIWKGLPGSPTAGGEIDLAALPASPRSLAISDDGEVVLAGVAESLYLVKGDGSAAPLSASGHLDALAFLAGNHDAVAADTAGNRLLLIRNADGSGETKVLAENLQPALVAVSRDNRKAYATTSAGIIWSVDLQSGETHQTDCGCAITSLQRLSGNALFRLTGDPSNPLLLFEDHEAGPRILFIPAER